MKVAANRPRLRFSLRTLFVVVTVLGLSAGWLAGQVKWLRDREQAIDDLHQNYAAGVLPAHRVSSKFSLSHTPENTPRLMRLFGVRAISSLGLVQPADVDRYQRLFPEVLDIHCTDGTWYYRDSPSATLKRRANP